MTANLRLSSFLPSALKLEGYLTGVIVSPGLIKPSLWFASLFDGDDRIFDNEDEVKEVLGAVMIRYNLLCNEIDRSLRRFEDRRICDYRPAFLTTSDQPTHSDLLLWNLAREPATTPA